MNYVVECMNDVEKVDTSGHAIQFAGFARLTALYQALWRDKLVSRRALSGYFPFGNFFTPVIGYTDAEPDRRGSVKWPRIRGGP